MPRPRPALVFERLWQDSGCRDTLAAALAPRRFRFDVERAVFATVLHRLFSPGSDRSASKWLADQAVDGAADLRLQHLYRAMAWLGEELPRPESEDDSGSGAAAAKHGKGSPPTTRCVKDRLEEHLFWRRRNLFSGLDLVFFDTTSHDLHGAGGSQLGRRGKSKDFRPQRPQLVVGLALSGDGRPLCTEIWPGNTADVTTLLPVGKRLRERFELASTCLVADRGMISRATMDALERRGWGYILGCRIRNTKECRETVLQDQGEETLLELERKGRREPLRLHIREVTVRDGEGGSERRYVVCRNGEQARRDKAVREVIVTKLREQLRTGGGRKLVGNRGYRRYLQAPAGSLQIDEAKIADEERYDGVWMLRVQGPFTAEEAARKYKQLWRVERCFRDSKSLLRTRPVFHRTDAGMRGHVFCSFLALLLKTELEKRLQAAGIHAEWQDVVGDLLRLRESVVEAQGKRFVVRTRAVGHVADIVRCVGARLPPTVRLEQDPGARQGD
ncbi:MAG: transposase [Bryobacterales bacterium]|nr:transposase [Bryobacterales bacterium]